MSFAVPIVAGGVTSLDRSNSAAASDCVSLSNRCFPTKAVDIWHQTSDDQHVQLVGSYFRLSEKWGEPKGRIWRPGNSDPLFAVWAERA
jgi:hypothetical protein